MKSKPSITRSPRDRAASSVASISAIASDRVAGLRLATRPARVASPIQMESLPVLGPLLADQSTAM
jgi:hypothetical protein